MATQKSGFAYLLACSSLYIYKFAILVYQKSGIVVGHFDPLTHFQEVGHPGILFFLSVRVYPVNNS